MDEFENKLKDWVQDYNLGKVIPPEVYLTLPALRFGIETFLEDDGSHVFTKSDFVNGQKGIRINGLIWMGDQAFMKKQIAEKIRSRIYLPKTQNWQFWDWSSETCYFTTYT